MPGGGSGRSSFAGQKTLFFYFLFFCSQTQTQNSTKPPMHNLGQPCKTWKVKNQPKPNLLMSMFFYWNNASTYTVQYAPHAPHTQSYSPDIWLTVSILLPFKSRTWCWPWQRENYKCDPSPPTLDRPDDSKKKKSGPHVGHKFSKSKISRSIVGSWSRLGKSSGTSSPRSWRRITHLFGFLSNNSTATHVRRGATAHRDTQG